VLYALTDAGRGFRDVSEAITRWGKLIVRAQGQAHASRGRRTG
jgi:hypothetical protein